MSLGKVKTWQTANGLSRPFLAITYSIDISVTTNIQEVIPTWLLIVLDHQDYFMEWGANSSSKIENLHLEIALGRQTAWADNGNLSIIP